MTLQLTFFAPREGRAGFEPLHFSPRSTYFLDHLLHRDRPDERLGGIVPGCQKLIHRSLQVRHTHKAAASDCLVCQFSEPAFDQVQPARAGRDEVANKARLLPQPSLHVRLFMRSIIVHDQMELESGGKSADVGQSGVLVRVDTLAQSDDDRRFGGQTETRR